ncbi:hypothetical protein [Nostoc sp.]|uniref:hypothetical protein n=1 Tax=Nostoc sp. TaxID=1180 RepID=UPI002FFAFDBF
MGFSIMIKSYLPKNRSTTLGIIGLCVISNALFSPSAWAGLKEQTALKQQKISNLKIANSGGQTLNIPERLPANILNRTPQDIVQIVPKKVFLEFGRLALRHPTNWIGALQPRSGKNSTDLYMLSNTTNFNGRPDQILLRIFEPVEILEKTGVQHYNPKDAFSIYQNFLQAENGGITVNASDVDKQEIGGRTFWTWSQTGPFDIIWIGFVNEYGILNVISTGVGKKQFSRFVNHVYAVALTTTYIPPSRQLDNPERAISNYLKTIQSGNISAVHKQFCSSNQVTIKAFDRLITDGKGQSLVDAYFKIASQIYSTDMSGLYYETKYYDENKGRAIVRISGNVLLKSANNKTLLVPYNRLNQLKRDYFKLIREGSDWKICDNIFSL